MNASERFEEAMQKADIIGQNFVNDLKSHLKDHPDVMIPEHIFEFQKAWITHLVCEIHGIEEEGTQEIRDALNQINRRDHDN